MGPRIMVAMKIIKTMEIAQQMIRTHLFPVVEITTTSLTALTHQQTATTRQTHQLMAVTTTITSHIRLWSQSRKILKTKLVQATDVMVMTSKTTLAPTPTTRLKNQSKMSPKVSNGTARWVQAESSLKTM